MTINLLNDESTEHSKGLRILEETLVVIGLFLVSLSVFLPILIGTVTQYRGADAAFMSRYLRAFTPFITTVSMTSSFVVAAVLLSFEKTKTNFKSVLFGVMTLFVFAAEISLSIYLSWVRSLVAGAPAVTWVLALIGLVPLGLGCTMFTLASIMSAR